MKLDLTPPWRRTVMAMAFTFSGAALTAFAVWLVWIVWRGGWPVALAGQQLQALAYALFGVLALLGLVLAGLAMTVSLRSASAKFLTGELSMTGGAGEADKSGEPQP